MRACVFLCLLAAILSAVPPPAEAGRVYVWEGFEREINWAADPDGAATGVVVDSGSYTEGAHSLKLLFNASSPASRAEYEREEGMDWSPYGVILFDVYVPGDMPDFRVGFEAETTGQKLKHRILSPPLKAGWNRDVRIDLTAPGFSAAASDWKPAGYLVGRDEIRKVKILLIPGKAVSGAACLDNIRLERLGVLAAGDFTLNSTLDATVSGVDIDYLPTDMRIRRSDLRAVESFEDGATWTPPDGVTVGPAADFTSHGTSALSVAFPALPDGFELKLDGMETRLAGSRQLRMAVYNSGHQLSVALRLEGADGNTYTSQKVSLAHGWNKPIFDFTNQQDWDGAAITDGVLRNLSAVVLEVYPRYPGRLVFDGLAVGSISLRGAARTGALLSLSYNPLDDLEVIVNTRVEDTFYGSSVRRIHEAGTEGFFDSASVRYDAGDFRSRFLYRLKPTAFDNPVIGLVSPKNLGNETAAFEMGGRVWDTEMQGLAASRLEYGRYDSRVPTAFGPENLAGLRLRRDLAEGVRLGGTFINHESRYGRGVSGYPASRRTYGIDLDSRFGGDEASLGLALLGAGTWGDRYVDSANAPRNDRYCAGVGVSPEVGRASFNYSYTLVGYDFDAEFTNKGGNSTMHYAEFGVDLEDWSVFRGLSGIPLYDGSIGRNLRMGLSAYTYETRDRYIDPATGELFPRSGGWYAAFELDNDENARPNFSFYLETMEQYDEWTREPEMEESLALRLPAPQGTVAILSGKLGQARPEDRTSRESGEDFSRTGQLGLEKWFESNLSVNIFGNWVWTRSSWEGAWSASEMHFRLTAGARQTLGASTVIQLDYGLPALNGLDYGAQETINIFTLYVKSYF